MGSLVLKVSEKTLKSSSDCLFFAPPAQVHLPGQAGRTLVPSSVCIQQEAGKTGSSRCCSTGSDWRGWEGSPHWGAYPSWGTDFSGGVFSFSIMKPEHLHVEPSLAQHVDKAVHNGMKEIADGKRLCLPHYLCWKIELQLNYSKRLHVIDWPPHLSRTNSLTKEQRKCPYAHCNIIITNLK